MFLTFLCSNIQQSIDLQVKLILSFNNTFLVYTVSLFEYQQRNSNQQDIS